MQNAKGEADSQLVQAHREACEPELFALDGRELFLVRVLLGESLFDGEKTDRDQETGGNGSGPSADGVLHSVSDQKTDDGHAPFEESEREPDAPPMRPGQTGEAKPQGDRKGI